MNAKIQKVIAAALCCAILAGCASNNSADSPADESSQTETSEQPVQARVNSVTMEGQTLGMEKLSNARQLGGYVTEDGKMRVKSGVLLRTAKLCDASEADIQKLRDTYHLTDIIDMRATLEIENDPDPEIDGAKNTHIIIIDENGDAAASSSGRLRSPAAITANICSSFTVRAGLTKTYIRICSAAKRALRVSASLSICSLNTRTELSSGIAQAERTEQAWVPSLS